MESFPLGNINLLEPEVCRRDVLGLVRVAEGDEEGVQAAPAELGADQGQVLGRVHPES